MEKLQELELDRYIAKDILKHLKVIEKDLEFKIHNIDKEIEKICKGK